MIQLDLFYRRPSKAAREAMCRTAMNLRHVPGGRYEETAAAEEGVKDVTGHDHTKIVTSGNSAILSVMSTFPGKVLIPDQGGWTGFRKMAEFVGREVREVPTELGIINVDELSTSLSENKPDALFITSFAGYMAEQPVKEIYEICSDAGVTLVEDASGSVGDRTGKLANGDHAHVLVASTGAPKTVNVGSGGFISTNDKKIFEDARDILKAVKAGPVTCAGIAQEIKNAPQVLAKTAEACEFIKKGLKNGGLNKFRDPNDLGAPAILHPDKRGINICISTSSPKKTGYKLRKSFKVHGGGIVTVCPRYERIMVDAVCLEVKNLDLKCLKPENLQVIIKIIEETLV
jgi:hypothetical protein